MQSLRCSTSRSNLCVVRRVLRASPYASRNGRSCSPSAATAATHLERHFSPLPSPPGASAVAATIDRRRWKHGGAHIGGVVSDDGREVVFRLDDSGVATLTMNRPKAANAMGTAMLSQLREALSYLRRDFKGDRETSVSSSVRCVVLTSCTDRVFSAGADLRERSKMSQEEAAVFVTSLRSTFDEVASLPFPVIAAVEGVAVGGGLEIALTADIIVAGEKAKFGLPETSLAIIPGAGGTQRLPRLIGQSRAKELIYTGRRIDSKTAYEYGLVQSVVDAGCAEKRAQEIAHEIAQNGPLAICAAKSAINRGLNTSLKEGMAIERECYQTVIPTLDRLEGLAAFREGRKPVYKGE